MYYMYHAPKKGKCQIVSRVKLNKTTTSTLIAFLCYTVGENSQWLFDSEISAWTYMYMYKQSLLINEGRLVL